MKHYYYRRSMYSTHHILTQHEELVEEYKTLFNGTSIRFNAKIKSIRRDMKLHNVAVKSGSSAFMFSLITDYNIHYVCSVIISTDNQVLFVCKSALNKEVKKLQSAQSVKQCIKLLKRNGTLRIR